MIRINLLPFRAARTKENIRRQVSILFLSFVLVTIILLVYNSHLSGKIRILKANADTLEKEVSLYRKKAKEVDKIKKDLDIMKKKIAVIDDLEKNRNIPVAVMEAFTEELLPQRMWLTSLEKHNMSLNVNGIALDNKTVADFMINLERTALISNVNLKTLQQKSMKDGKNLKTFEIGCAMSPSK